ncbi:MAG: YceI family protein [Propionivibrio sp.]|uniref:YceI family protein n=1 Tax=Candidatus Propionivibrio dominans TaxID=2954373 RepID=A0A9D7ICU9_9RHOO|nr:YceI family protein [Candidatus Propionivibrio dominans]
MGLWCLAGCQTSPEYPSTPLQTSWAPLREARPENAVRYEILPDLSDIRFLVYRAGPLARFGHNHVVQAKNIRGEIYLAPDIHQSSFFIEIPVKDFQVDAENARLDEGEVFFPLPDEDAIAGTTRNMLGEKVLDAARYPKIEIKSLALTGPAWGMDITMRIKMHGVEREIVVPSAVESSNGKLVVTAFFSINQTDFGITPMSVLGGGLQVQDAIKVRMRIVAGKGDSRPQ